MSSGRSDRFRATVRFAWRYLLISPLILEIFHFLEIFYLQVLLPDMALVATALDPWTIDGGLILSYAWNGPWCALFGAACGGFIRPSSRKSLAAFSSVSMGVLVILYEIAHTLYAQVHSTGAMDAIGYIGLLFLIFIKGAAAGSASAYFSYRPIAVRPDPGIFA